MKAGASPILAPPADREHGDSLERRVVRIGEREIGVLRHDHGAAGRDVELFRADSEAGLAGDRDENLLARQAMRHRLGGRRHRKAPDSGFARAATRRSKAGEADAGNVEARSVGGGDDGHGGSSFACEAPACIARDGGVG